jgi:pyruvyltransferase
MVKTYWYRGNWDNDFGNVGDIVTPYILKHLFKSEFESCDRDDTGKLLAVGSVIEFLRDNDIVWGSGLIEPMELQKKDGVQFVSVRGPLTANALEAAGYDVPERFGEPCFMLPDIYNPKVRKEHNIGIVPHYVDEEFVRGRFPGFKIISPMNSVEGFIDEILKCNLIISSSLHGIVIPEAYGIPSKWVRYSDKVIGGHFKFHDYYLGTGRTPKEDEWQPLPSRKYYIHLNKFLEIWEQFNVTSV